jgi:hypothetical protein
MFARVLVGSLGLRIANGMGAKFEQKTNRSAGYASISQGDRSIGCGGIPVVKSDVTSTAVLGAIRGAVRFIA